MRDLTKKEKSFLKMILTKNATKHRGYWRYRINEGGFYRTYTKSRVVMQLYLGKKLEVWELVCHKDCNKSNDSIENLEVLNAYELSEKYTVRSIRKPKDWKPANTLKKEVVNRILDIADQMVRVNYSEVARRLEKEGIKVSSATVARYL